MNDDGQIEQGSAGAPEGAVATAPTIDEVGEMYKELGIKAPSPTGKPKGRPKTTDVRAKDDSDDDDDDSKPGRKNEAPSKDKPSDAPTADKDDDSGDNSDAKGAKVGKDSGKVSDESAKADGSVHYPKPTSKKDTEQGSEDGVKPGDNGTGQATDDENDAEEEGKRPGKSNPKVEQRFQKLTSDVKERDELIEKLQNELRDSTTQQREDKVAQEDPAYIIQDFAKVHDVEGNVLELDENQAELAWRRWKDGYDQRKNEREAKANHEIAQQEQQTQMSEHIMRQSVEAYDTLAGLMDEFPQLVSTSSKFDKEFATEAMPIIQEALIYQTGTEPGNTEGLKSVIMGLRLNPKNILKAMESISKQKRSLPLNGVNDNVEVGSNVNVPHSSRSSDATVNAANDLYKELKIDKRF